jgi:hypothetical protein
MCELFNERDRCQLGSQLLTQNKFERQLAHFGTESHNQLGLAVQSSGQINN